MPNAYDFAQESHGAWGMGHGDLIKSYLRDKGITGLTQIARFVTIYSVWCAVRTLHLGSMRKSCIRVNSE